MYTTEGVLRRKSSVTSSSSRVSSRRAEAGRASTNGILSPSINARTRLDQRGAVDGLHASQSCCKAPILLAACRGWP